MPNLPRLFPPFLKLRSLRRLRSSHHLELRADVGCWATIAGAMKLEYLPDGSDMCPLVRLYEFDTVGARRLHDAFCSLALGSLQHVSLEEIVSVDSIDGCRITFTRGTQDRGVVQTAEREFDVLLSSQGWAHTAGLAEPFCDNCSAGYQWLTEHAGDIQLLFSPGGDW